MAEHVGHDSNGNLLHPGTRKRISTEGGEVETCGWDCRTTPQKCPKLQTRDKTRSHLPPQIYPKDCRAKNEWRYVNDLSWRLTCIIFPRFLGAHLVELPVPLINSIAHRIFPKPKNLILKFSRLNACLFFPVNLLFVRGFLKMPSYFQEIFNHPPMFINSSKREREKLQVAKSVFQQFYLFSYIVFPTAHSLAALSSLSKISLSSPFLAWISG